MTARCRVYAHETALAPVRSEFEFWQRLEETFAKTIDLIKEAAKEAGLGVEELMESRADQSSPWDHLDHDELVQLGRRYAEEVEQWLERGWSIQGLCRTSRGVAARPLSLSSIGE